MRAVVTETGAVGDTSLLGEPRRRPRADDLFNAEMSFPWAP